MIGRNRRAPAVVLALLFVAAGCGGMAKMQPPGEPSTANLDELQQRIDRQEAIIQRQLAGREAPAGPQLDELQQRPEAGGTTEASGETAPAPPPAAPEEPGAGSEEPRKKAEASAAEDASVGSTCDLVCKALASMRRSADRICEITGDEDPRCTKARGRVSDAASRVERAGCTCRSE